MSEEIMDNVKPTFIGILLRGWKSVAMSTLITVIVAYALTTTIVFPYGFCIALWIVIGQALLTNYKAVSEHYPQTFVESLKFPLMATVWPYFCYFRR